MKNVLVSQTQIERLVTNIVKENDDMKRYMPRWNRVRIIEDRKEFIKGILPTIVKYFKRNFSDYISDIVIQEKPIRYGNDIFDTTYFFMVIILKPKYNKYDIDDFSKLIKEKLYEFGIDIMKYGMPLDFKVELQKP